MRISRSTRSRLLAPSLQHLRIDLAEQDAGSEHSERNPASTRPCFRHKRDVLSTNVDRSPTIDQRRVTANRHRRGWRSLQQLLHNSAAFNFVAILGYPQGLDSNDSDRFSVAVTVPQWTGVRAVAAIGLGSRERSEDEHDDSVSHLLCTRSCGIDPHAHDWFSIDASGDSPLHRLPLDQDAADHAENHREHD